MSEGTCAECREQYRAKIKGLEAEVRRLRAEGERAGPLEKALRDAADALWAACQMLSAINTSEPSRDRNNAAMAASRAASAARHALDVANPLAAPLPKEDAPRCMACGGTGRVWVEGASRPCDDCGGTGRSPSTTGGGRG